MLDSLESPSASIALLIDADNSPASKIDFVVTELASHGVVNIRRAYGNWTKAALRGWRDLLFDHAIEPVQMFDMVKGKNGTDMRLLIDAMDILYGKDVKIFALVTSACDFSPLCTRLRAEGKSVLGFGGQNTPEPFINACSRFLYLDDDSESKEQKIERKRSGNQLKGNTKLIQTLRHAIDAVSDEEGWAQLGAVGSHISKQGPFDHRTFGYPKLSDLFQAIDLFELRKIDQGGQPVLQVRKR